MGQQREAGGANDAVEVPGRRAGLGWMVDAGPDGTDQGCLLAACAVLCCAAGASALLSCLGPHPGTGSREQGFCNPVVVVSPVGASFSRSTHCAESEGRRVSWVAAELVQKGPLTKPTLAAPVTGRGLKQRSVDDEGTLREFEQGPLDSLVSLSS